MILMLNGCQGQKLWYLFLNCSVDVPPLRFQMEKEHQTLFIPIVSSSPLTATNKDTTYIVIMIHGGGLNAENSFKTAKQLAESLGVSMDQFLILAPQFLEGIKRNERGLLFWDQNWRSGGMSLSTVQNENLPSLSSFEVIDRLIGTSVQRNPNIRKIIILGHSAGGQFVLRYAAVNSRHEQLAQQGVTIQYVVANPSSYLYLDGSRYQFNSEGEIEEVPKTKLLECPGYNRYKYGMENLYGYAKELPLKAIRARLLTRPIIFLLGTEDKDRNWSLDTSCEGDAQEKNRYQRGVLYKYHLEQMAGKSLSYHHTWLGIPDAGHASTKILTHMDFVNELKSQGF